MLEMALLILSLATGNRQPAAHQDEEAVALRAVRVTTGGEAGALVTIEADSALPVPASGTLAGPPRLYLDFPGVLPGSLRTATGAHPLLRGVRIALHSINPAITRVVLDLVKPTTHEIQVNGGPAGRISIALGAASHAPVESGSPPRQTQATSDVPKPPASPQVARYLRQISPAVARLRSARPSLVAIDRRGPEPAGDLIEVELELGESARELAAMKPPASHVLAHDLLTAACSLAARAVRLRRDAIRTGDATAALNAASAAAGAVMMFERASTDLGLAGGGGGAGRE